MRIVFMLTLFLTPLLGAELAYAQLNNRPYSFPNSADGGVGMSNAARQAIINDEIFSFEPANLQRGPDGRLVNVIDSEESQAIVTTFGGDVLPRFRGTSWRYPGAAVGVFNEFFDETRGSGFSASQRATRLSIAGWTTFMSTPGFTHVRGYPAVRSSYSPVSTHEIDGWMSMVMNLENVVALRPYQHYRPVPAYYRR